MTTLLAPPPRSGLEGTVGRDTVEQLVDGSRLSAVLELCKPKIALMVLVTVAAGYGLGTVAPGATFSWLQLLATFVGVTMVSFAAAALNQALEHQTDAMMPRTAGRPIPSGRASVADAMFLAMMLGPWGCALLAFGAHPLCAGLTALTLVLYAFVYTPLKRHSAWATFVGAVPGAMPPVLGWAATGSLDWGACALFGLLFLWQFPHFLAIAWKYKDQYHRAGLKMLPPPDQLSGGPGLATGWIAVVTAAFLVPVSLSLVPLGLAGWLYAVVAAGFGGWYLWRSVTFLRERTLPRAVALMVVSFVYLPAVLTALGLDAVLRTAL